MDESNIEWGIRQGFLRQTEQWETHGRDRARPSSCSRTSPRWS